MSVCVCVCEKKSVWVGGCECVCVCGSMNVGLGGSVCVFSSTL